jgi:hypothetical protein
MIFPGFGSGGRSCNRFRVDRCAARQRSGDQRKIGVAADELLKIAGIPGFILEQASEASA